VSNVKNARAEASNDFGECRLIFVAREAGQFNFGRLFVVVRQKRAFWSAPAERSGDGALDEVFIWCVSAVTNPTGVRRL
jgi:hypothetical protein